MTVLRSERPTEQSALVDNLIRGSCAPLGAMPCPDGVNFSIYSKHATGIELLLFDHVDDAKAARTMRIDPCFDGRFRSAGIRSPRARMQTEPMKTANSIRRLSSRGGRQDERCHLGDSWH